MYRNILRGEQVWEFFLEHDKNKKVSTREVFQRWKHFEVTYRTVDDNLEVWFEYRTRKRYKCLIIDNEGWVRFNLGFNKLETGAIYRYWLSNRKVLRKVGKVLCS